jgi:galactosylceramidase
MEIIKKAITRILIILLISISCKNVQEKTLPEDFTIEVSLGDTTDTFEGVGAVSAGASSRLLIDYPEPFRSQILDFLFKPRFGAGFQHLKVEIGGDINSTDGSEPGYQRQRGVMNFNRGYEWWLMKEAKKRNPDIILDALAWGFPGWIGNGNYHTQEGADYIKDFLLGAKQHHGLDIEYVGIWNERDFNGNYIKLLRKTLDDNGLQNVKIVANDMNGPPKDMWEIADSMLSDPELARAIDVIGIHYPHGDVPGSAKKMKLSGKRLWSSEDGEWDWWSMRPSIRYLRVQELNFNYLKMGLTKTEYWSPVTSYYDCLPAPSSGVIKANTPWSGEYLIDKSLWLVAHYTQFADPGWKYIKGGSKLLPDGASVVTLASADSSLFSVILETTTVNTSREYTLRVPSEVKKVHVWRTNDLEKFMQQPDLVSSDGEIKFTAEDRSVYTLTNSEGQMKGISGSPNPGLFPLPYYEKFEDYNAESSVKYLSDQSGSYEVGKGIKGSYLRQQISFPGIDWSSGKSAFTIMGDMNWRNISVSTDVLFEECNDSDTTVFASVISRNYQGSVWKAFFTSHPVGYNLILYINGKWELTTASKIIASGRTSIDKKEWINLSLECSGDKIRALIGGKEVAYTSDNTYSHGLIGIGSSYSNVLFDNLLIK